MLHYLQSRKFVALTAGLLALILFLTAIAFISILQHREALQHTNTLGNRMAAQVEQRFSQVPPLSSQELQRLRTYLNPQHVETAGRFGISNLSDRETIAQFEDQGRLVRLDDNPFFYLREMDYSVPSLVPNAANLLDLIGRRFQQALEERGLPPYRYVITSATRSRQDQARLSRSNVNAARKSSHEFGTTVDLHYAQFNFPYDRVTLPDSLSDSPRPFYENSLSEHLAAAYRRLAETQHEHLKAILGRVLLDLQAEGKVLVIYERRQPVYHITVADNVEAVPPPSEDDSVAMKRPAPEVAE